MRLKLAFDVSIDSGILQYGGNTMSSKWAADAAERLRQRQQIKQQQDALMLEQRKLRTEQGPNLWAEVCEFVKQRCIELNANYGSVIVRVKDVKLGELDARFELNGVVVDLHSTFEPSSSQKALNWSYSNIVKGAKAGKNSDVGGSCSLDVSPSGRVVFHDGDNQRTPESIAQEMLNGLISE